MSKFKVGDKVLITKDYRVIADSKVGYNKHMEKYLGTQQVISKVSASDSMLGEYYKIKGDTVEWSFPVEALTLVQPKVKPEKTKVKATRKYSPRMNRNSGHSTGVRFPLTVKLQAVALRNTGMSRYAVAERLNTSSKSVLNWEKQHAAGQFNEPIAFQRTCEMIRS